jgi:hypothetical protein
MARFLPSIGENLHGERCVNGDNKAVWAVFFWGSNENKRRKLRCQTSFCVSRGFMNLKLKFNFSSFFKNKFQFTRSHQHTHLRSVNTQQQQRECLFFRKFIFVMKVSKEGATTTSVYMKSNSKCVE